MVELKGTEKQVKWATKIRDLSIDILNERLNDRIEFNKLFFENKGKDNTKTLNKIEKIKNTINKISSIDDSSWFINELRHSNAQAELIIKIVEDL